MIVQKSYCRPQNIWTVRSVLQAARRCFPSAVSVSRRVVAHVCQATVEWTFMCPEALLDRALVVHIFSCLRRIQQGEPLSRILGKREFFGYDFCITQDTLDPRPETELVVQICLDLLARNVNTTVMDLGTGSGCIALSVLLKSPKTQAILLDKSQEALLVARHNARAHGVFERCHFVAACMAEYVGKPVDCICSNPPYIAKEDMSFLPENVIKYDPFCALYGGDKGLLYYRIILERYATMLQKKGYLILELGINQAKPVCALAKNYGWSMVSLHKDSQGIKRVVVFQKGSCGSL